MGAKAGRILGFAGIPIGVDTVGQIQLGCSAGNPYLAICDIGICHQSCADVPLGLVPGRREIPGAIGRSLPPVGRQLAQTTVYSLHLRRRASHPTPTDPVPYAFPMGVSLN